MRPRTTLVCYLSLTPRTPYSGRELVITVPVLDNVEGIGAVRSFVY